ncbi:hypothetical protein CAG54_06440 [Vibrio sp. V27_P1S3P104]|nr:hypothetical protein [Vibrio sp. V28_P6S34P95]NAX05390.1 hypothetical protein [Vibrio sp. V30_P3S12P165]NAX34901.1 hypothetical protein [Vibrio sp. V29_P1S30P107]NAX37148.1 hypothetical protein [Vibrio sp. V27_P1S3P104]NAX39468.1 hypothetical protein [Vibrio sp. V26_P1S5P106]NNN43481.1 hypothetical protein [Vibrio sp. 1-1(7)]NNN71305.1 hypothetical protein [Vibrio sp. 12-2(3-a)]
MVCGQTIGLSSHELPFIALLIPVLWVLPRSGLAGLVLLIGMATYGITLAHQPAALSVSMWVVFPLMMVAFSRASNMGIMAVSGLILLTLQVGIMVTQSAEKLDGTPSMTFLQLLSVMAIWWAANSWKFSPHRHWWALILLVPLWIAEATFAVLLALCITGLLAIISQLVKASSFQWAKLLCWTLPSIAFMAVVISPAIEVPNSVFVVWLCLLSTAWMTDYLLKSTEEPIS